MTMRLSIVVARRTVHDKEDKSYIMALSFSMVMKWLHMLQNERKENEKNTITHSSNTSKLDIAFQIYLGKWAIEVKKETLVMESIWSWNEGTTRSS